MQALFNLQNAVFVYMRLVLEHMKGGFAGFDLRGVSSAAVELSTTTKPLTTPSANSKRPTCSLSVISSWLSHCQHFVIHCLYFADLALSLAAMLPLQSPTECEYAEEYPDTLKPEKQGCPQGVQRGQD